MAETIPTNAYESVLTSTAALWHTGGGSIGFTFVQSVPDSYVSGDGFEIGGQSFDLDIDPRIGVEETLMLRTSLQRFAEIADLGLTELVEAPARGGSVSALVSGLGGSAGFGEITVPRSDDGYFAYDITSVMPNGINVYGTVYDQMFVNTNGSVSFGNGVLSYSPRAISDGYTPMFAPFWADIDTRAGALKGDESGEIHVDFDTVNAVITVTWDNVNYYDRNGKSQNSFQVQIVFKGGTDYNVLLRYGDINWVSGDASGGTNGVGGIVATAGVTAGTGSNAIEIPGSGKQGKMLALETTVGNTGEIGVWQFKGRGGSLDLQPALATTPAAAPAPEEDVGAILLGALDFGAGAPDAIASGPGSAAQDGDIWLNSAGPDFADFGGAGQAAALAAIGTALGLSETAETGSLPADFDNRLYTMMSSNPVPGQSGANLAAPQTPMLLDLQALQIAYGANLETRTGDDVYFAPGGTTSFTIGDGETLIATIWDAGGIDTFSADNQSEAVSIDLRPGEFSQIGADFASIGIAKGVAGQRARSALIENAIGGSGDDFVMGTGYDNTLWGRAGDDLLQGLSGKDTLIGEGGADMLKAGKGEDRLFGGAGDDVLKGQNGQDRLNGGPGDDQLFGGNGADTFLFQPSAGADKVRDFTDGSDLIDVSDFGVRFADIAIAEIEPGHVTVAIGTDMLALLDTADLLHASDITAADFIGLI
ncbi:MAG: nidogen-like domain-containing protein [Pseudomonadota bacterium]